MTLRFLLKSLVLPPLLQLLMLVAAAVLWRFYPRLARILAALAVTSLWLLATPWVSERLMHSLENDYPVLSPSELPGIDAQAIVILAGGMNLEAEEFDSPAVTSNTLIRLRYGAFVHRRTGLPILVSGGSMYRHTETSLADAMALSLERHFQVETRWLEERSGTTAENARYSAQILADAGVKRVLLVTEGFHMPRSVYSFRQAGVAVVAAPTSNTAPESGLPSWVPNALALYRSHMALYEHFGFLTYRLLL